MVGVTKLERAVALNAQRLNQINLIVAYYNCATECEFLKWYDRSLRYLEKGIQ
jgi:hypothetical protein